jgi:hypothetical protein
MDNIPVEYSERMMAEQMVMMEALQFIAQFLICFFLLAVFVVLIVNLSGFVCTRLSERRQADGFYTANSNRSRAHMPKRRAPKDKRAPIEFLKTM